MSLEKVRWCYRPPERGTGLDLEQIVAARNHLSKSLEESRVAGDLVHERLQDFQLRLSSVTRAMAPIHEESKISTEVSSRIDKAIESIMSLHKLDDVGRNLRKIIAGEPFLDLDGYLAALIQLQDAIGFHRHESDAAVRSLQETLTFLETASTDSRRTGRLRKILKDLRAEQTGKYTSVLVSRPFVNTLVFAQYFSGQHREDAIILFSGINGRRYGV